MKNNVKSITMPQFLKDIAPTCIALLAGICFAANPGILEVLCVTVGIMLVLSGVAMLLYRIFGKQKSPLISVYSLIFLVLGIAFGIVPTMLKFLIPIFFGAWLLTSSASGMYHNYMLRHVHPLWWLGLTLCTIGSLIGLYVITRPAQIMESTVRLIGFALIAHSVLRLTSILFSARYQKELDMQQNAENSDPPEYTVDEDGIIEITLKE